MGSTELAANLFRATQTEEKLRRENVRNKDQANRIHGEVGRKVRKTIHELGGTMPESLPVAESIKKVESREKKRLKAGQKNWHRMARSQTHKDADFPWAAWQEWSGPKLRRHSNCLSKTRA